MATAMAWLLGGAVLALTVLIGGLGGAAYAVVVVLSAVPGLPLGFLLFGRRHVAGWLAGFPFGYAVTALSIWLAIVVGASALPAMLAVWALVTATLWYFVPRRPVPLAALPAWGRRDTLALVAFLWLVPLLVGPAFRNVGTMDQEGNRLYRAYFTADFLWHTALTTELARFSMPPVNPYVASEPLHYYWTFFLLPAAAAHHATPMGQAVERILLVNNLYTGLAFFGMLFVATWVAVPRAFAVLGACALAAVAASAEGAYSLWTQWQKGAPIMAAVRDLNIDAITAWQFGGLRIDGLPRSLWYVPQHAMSVACGLIAVAVVAVTGTTATMGAILMSGVALACATIMSPILGAAFSVVYGLSVVLGSLATAAQMPRILARHAVAAVPVLLAIAWVYGNGVLEGAGGALQLGVGPLARSHPLMSLMLSLGPVLAAALAGLVVWRSWSRAVLPGLAGLIVGGVALYGVHVPLDEAYIGFRAGQVLLVTMPMLAARYFALADLGGWRRAAVFASAVLLFAIGSPTTVIDAFNAQDVTNRTSAPELSWTLVVTPAEQLGLKWLARATPEDAVVQVDPIVRGRQNWTYIPSLAQRRMAAGLPISLLNKPIYMEASQRVHTMYVTLSANRACGIAHGLGIDYVYMDTAERSAIPAPALEKFRQYPECFRSVFRNGEVDIFAVVPQATPRR